MKSGEFGNNTFYVRSIFLSFLETVKLVPSPDYQQEVKDFIGFVWGRRWEKSHTGQKNRCLAYRKVRCERVRSLMDLWNTSKTISRL